MPYTIIDHTADVGITVRAPSLPALFTEAALALIEIMGAKIMQGGQEIILAVEGYDREDLLIRWLQEIRYRIEVEDLRIAGMTIDALDAQSLTACINGSFTATPLTADIKAVTYHAVAILQVGDHLETTIIFDT